MKKILSIVIVLSLALSSVLIFEPQVINPVSAIDDTQLTTSPYIDDLPAWSPDGQKIVYRAYDSSGWNRHIWIMNADGTNKQQLTFGNVVDGEPSFSPDGSKIYFSRWGLRGDYTDLMVMNVEGTDITRLTYGPDGVMYLHPVVSPDSTKIAFLLNYGTSAGPYDFWIGLMDSDKIVYDLTGVEILTRGADGVWVSNGEEILYSLYDPNENTYPSGCIMIMNNDGTNVRQLTSSPFDGFPSLSPDNQKIVFHRASVPQLTDGDIYIMDTDGSNIERLTFDPWNLQPSFAPQLSDGMYEIVYVSRRTGNSDIWVMLRGVAEVSLPWRDDFNYNTLDEMKVAGWSLTGQHLIEVGGGTVALTNDGVTGPGVSYVGNFPLGIYDFNAECAGMRIVTIKGGLGIDIFTERHVYSWGADGWTSDYRFHRDGVLVLDIGGYVSPQDTWEIFGFKKIGNTIDLYYNGELKGTYIDPDETHDALTGAGMHSGWLITARYDYISVEPSWVKHANNPVLDVNPFSSWEDISVWSPSVLIDGSTYFMWYNGGTGDHYIRIGMATSADGIAWTRHGDPVLTPTKPWEGIQVSSPTVLKVGDTYMMWYCGGSVPQDIGFASSSDGISWTKHAGNPVISGAEPSVMFDGSTYKMWYSRSDHTIGYATSSDGIVWTVYSDPVLTPDFSWESIEVRGPSVLFSDPLYRMYYFARGPQGYYQIGYAESADGMAWAKPSPDPILGPGLPDSWDDSGVSHPHVVNKGSNQMMWYSGFDGTHYSTPTVPSYYHRIGLATVGEPTPQPDFEISTIPESRTIQAGDSVTYEVSIVPTNGFDSEVSLELEESELPAGISCSFNPQKITPGTTSTLEISTSLDTPLATSTIKIVGSGGGLNGFGTFELKTILSLEVSIEKFLTYSDVRRPFFKIEFGSDLPVQRSPKVGSELSISRAMEKYPGPWFLLYWDSQPTFPLDIRIKAFCFDIWGIEEEIDTVELTIPSASDLPETRVFVRPDIFMEIHVGAITPRRHPDSYPPDGITEELTPYLDKEWYWFAVGADKVWNSHSESDFDEVTVAVLDSGVDYNHPALDDVIWLNKGEIGLDWLGRDKKTNRVDDDNNGYVDDWNGFDFVTGYMGVDGKWYMDIFNGPMDEGEGEFRSHGTKVAGVIAATAQTGFIAGVAAVMRGNCRILPIRVGAPDPKPWLIADGIDYAIENEADVIVMSFATMTDYWFYGVPQAIERARKEGILVVAAAGNDRSMAPFYPASYSSVMSVSGVKRTHDSSYLSFFSDSNYGPNLKFKRGGCVEISAPAQSIVTTERNFGIEEYASGTSFAAPIVAATAALIKGYASQMYGRTLNPSEIRYMLRESAIDLGPSKWDPYYGYGMVDAYAALDMVDTLLSRKHWRIKLDPPADLDLHVFDSLGRHVGLNYETGDIEIEILGAVHTGDEIGGFETIYLPLDITDYEIQITGTEVDGSSPYNLQVVASSEAGDIYGEWNFQGETVEGAVYVYSVSIDEELMTVNPEPISELEHFKELIGGLPDDCFDHPIWRASHLKNALFNKIGEVILKVEAENYTDAINKLFLDIRAKMDGDSTPRDWIIDPNMQEKLCVIIDHMISSIETLQRD